MPERRIHGHRGRDLEQRQAPAPGDELRDVNGLTATESDHTRARRQGVEGRLEIGQLEAANEVDAGKVGAL